MLGRILLLLGLSLAVMPASALTIYKYTDANGVVTYSDQAAPGARVFLFRDRMVEKLDNQVKLETRKHAAGETLLVRNDLFAPVDIELSLSNVSNAVGAPDKPIRWVLPPRSQIRLATLAPRALTIGVHIRRGDSCHMGRYCPANLTSSYFAAAATLRAKYGANR